MEATLLPSVILLNDVPLKGELYDELKFGILQLTVRVPEQFSKAELPMLVNELGRVKEVMPVHP